MTWLVVGAAIFIALTIAITIDATVSALRELKRGDERERRARWRSRGYRNATTVRFISNPRRKK
jgi:hypothetical protein